MKVFTEDKNFNATNAQSTKQQKQTDKKEQQKVNAKYKWSETVVLGSNNFGLTAFNSYFYDISTQHPINNNLGFCKMFS